MWNWESLKKNLIMQWSFYVDREQNMKKNSYWLGAIKEYALIGMNRLLKTNFEEVLKNVDAVKLNTFIREFVSDTNTYEVIMKPKE